MTDQPNVVRNALRGFAQVIAESPAPQIEIGECRLCGLKLVANLGDVIRTAATRGKWRKLSRIL